MKIVRDNLTIRAAAVDDVPFLGKWWRDGAVMAHAGFPLGLQITDDEIAQSLHPGLLIIEVDGVRAGEMSYRDIGDKTAQIGIKICETDMQNKGYGTKLLDMLIAQLFEHLEFERIVLDTNAENVRAQRAYERLGFRKVAVHTDSWTNQLGHLQSSIDYELLKSEYKKRN